MWQLPATRIGSAIYGSFRLVTRLQLLNDDFGLDLTYATLAAMMKYPTCSNQTNKEKGAPVASKKNGFFKSEEHIARQVWEKTGLGMGRRHPAAFLMEACDDIAYVVLDAEDAVKKGLASFSDLLAFLVHYGESDPVVGWVVSESQKKHDSYRESEPRLSPSELNDVSMQRFRVYAIGELVKAATRAFIDNENNFLEGVVQKPLLEISRGEKLRKALKEFSYKHAYTHRSVLKVELQGYNVIRGLMDLFWAAIVDREKQDEPASDRLHPFSRFVYGRISENYRRIFETPISEVASWPMRYRECQLLTDMLSGMTDSYAIALHNELTEMQGDYNPREIRSAHVE
jgi:dGTPase